MDLFKSNQIQPQKIMHTFGRFSYRVEHKICINTGVMEIDINHSLVQNTVVNKLRVSLGCQIVGIWKHDTKSKPIAFEIVGLLVVSQIEHSLCRKMRNIESRRLTKQENS